jgi:hypothetical protein
VTKSKIFSESAYAKEASDSLLLLLLPLLLVLQDG